MSSTHSPDKLPESLTPHTIAPFLYTLVHTDPFGVEDPDLLARKRAAAFSALQDLGIERVRALLVSVVVDTAWMRSEEDRLIRSCAIRVLAKLDGERSLDVLLPLVVDPDFHVRARVSDVLDEVGRNERVIQYLLPLLAHHDADIRSFGCQQLGRSSDRTLVDSLLPLLQDHIIKVRCAAAKAIVTLDPHRAVPVLLPLLDDADESVRLSICDLFRTMHDARTVEPLVAHLQTDPSADVRMIAASALGNIGDVRALPALYWATDHDPGRDYRGCPVRTAAATAAIWVFVNHFFTLFATGHAAAAWNLLSPQLQQTDEGTQVLAACQQIIDQHGPCSETRVAGGSRVDDDHDQISVDLIYGDAFVRCRLMIGWHRDGWSVDKFMGHDDLKLDRVMPPNPKALGF